MPDENTKSLAERYTTMENMNDVDKRDAISRGDMLTKKYPGHFVKIQSRTIPIEMQLVAYR